MTPSAVRSEPPIEPARKRGRGIGVFVAGFGGGIVVMLATWALLVRMHSAAPEAPKPYEVTKDSVRLIPGAAQPQKFETAMAEKGTSLPHPPYTGRIASVETLTAPSFAPLSGRVVEVKVRIGSKVQQGDKLVEIRTADLAAMQRDLRAARLAVRTKQAVVDRLAQLVELRAAPNHDLLVARSELDEARFAVQAADAKLRALTVSQAGETNYFVLANRAGTVVQLDASPGKQVGPASERPVATVADLDEVLVLADVHQDDASDLRVSTRASISFPGSVAKAAEATIETISDVVDPERQTVPVRLRAPNPEHQFRPNAYVEVTFLPAETTQAVLVPSAAVVTDGRDAVVFVEVEPGLLKRRPVQLGRQSKEKAEIVSGVHPGERVVVRGALLLLNAINIQG